MSLHSQLNWYWAYLPPPFFLPPFLVLVFAFTFTSNKNKTEWTACYSRVLNGHSLYWFNYSWAVGVLPIHSVIDRKQLGRHTYTQQFGYFVSLTPSEASENILVQELMKALSFNCFRWFMPVNILLTFIIGSALAWVLIKLTGTPPYLQSLVIGCCAAGMCIWNILFLIILL